jgi:hypothetical protein
MCLTYSDKTQIKLRLDLLQSACHRARQWVIVNVYQWALLYAHSLWCGLLGVCAQTTNYLTMTQHWTLKRMSLQRSCLQTLTTYTLSLTLFHPGQFQPMVIFFLANFSSSLNIDYLSHDPLGSQP